LLKRAQVGFSHKSIAPDTTNLAVTFLSEASKAVREASNSQLCYSILHIYYSIMHTEASNQQLYNSISILMLLFSDIIYTHIYIYKTNHTPIGDFCGRLSKWICFHFTTSRYLSPPFYSIYYLLH
jgi:hypothetical protein